MKVEVECGLRIKLLLNHQTHLLPYLGCTGRDFNPKGGMNPSLVPWTQKSSSPCPSRSWRSLWSRGQNLLAVQRTAW